MDNKLLNEVVDKIKAVTVGVIGDFCLDAYFFIDNSASEISVETGLPTKPVRSHSYSLGGAGNLANNIASLEVKELRAYGAVGNDLYGREMLKIMEESSIRTSSMFVQNEQWSTHVYCKPYMKDEEQSRMDFGNFNFLSNETADKIINNLVKDIDDLDVILINQQVQAGIHTDYLRKKLGDIIIRYPKKIFISDIRDKNRLYNGTFLKINDIEAVAMCMSNISNSASVTQKEAIDATSILFEENDKPVFVTCGSRGSLAIDSSGLIKIPGLMHFGRIDPVGAGDSYLAGAAVSLAAGYDVAISAEIGSFVAGVTVRKLYQTGTASPAELIETGSNPDYIYEPELAEDIRKAGYFDNSEIEIINKIPENLQVRHAIFDHDGTISTLREGWELVMAPMMIRAILGEHYESAGKGIFDKVSESVNDLIDSTTGVQTLAQMASLVQLVRDYGFVAKEDILDMYGYKMIYNEELLKLVNERRRKFLNKELSVVDFTIKNAVNLVEKLYKKGIKLYLASGTDVEDVINEASLLGYDRFFEGGIYGAVGDINKEAKSIVLENILNKIDRTSHNQIITFGDGPVELRETRKAGGVCVGVASNEVRRFGLDQKKRIRLVKAGADIIVPDFSQSEALLKILNIK